MRITKENTVALVVDIQERLFPHIHDHQQLKKNIGILVDGLQALGVPMMVTEQYKKGLGPTIKGLAEKVATCPTFEKIAFSCMDDEAFIEKFETEGYKTAILFGIEAHICLMQTALDLQAKGYKPVVVEDCVGSRNPENHRIAINRMLQQGILVTSYESLLFELCRFAGTDTFKTISKLVK
ncbi:Nicotinamidase-related amidase [Saccharicrinis carchari]|uniref:Nicotinamidase-related amidase n=1 Tax=Saccharicrinis carchari TaxID=1168039 RepID=A0A521DY49_SACCC|nr:hydrolase [Saccharicrinis carchari]SMO76542.1 Nicotinamidase-related amidase [Saccharicrinis carchari]